jgi:acyl-coenzyme A synthetase/AMP-(fatty) acid ligase
VVLRSPDLAGDALARTLQDHCKSRLAPYKYPRVIEFRTELPKTATGKIQRFKLRAEHAADLSSSP